ncbi:hypothetical protein GCM10011391_26180 [Pullulanibacillus camelliae]|uniref:NodB homology domain-containing protein n=1 Tax=Pullulanibacillus camelliae TaxID=1707096 RepID=A0A8J3DW43_9BACL|nr:polysaccharide deacetylase family protein [Pullulanibacillus camelliae]GGE46143.1 hypothetical protein GCM10011391_26180 [Pullulanibacillus camelliae]
MRKRGLQYSLFAVLFVLTFSAFPSYKAFYQSQFIPSDREIQPVQAMASPLYQKIKSYAAKHNIKPINARTDSVWKAIPGYNGLQVNVKASYEKLKSSGHFNSQKLIYEETAPRVHLEDIQPAPIYKGNPEKPMVALVFDVASGGEYIPKILEILNQAELSSTFFLDAEWVKAHSNLALMISDENHEIGNFGMEQKDLTELSNTQATKQLENANKIIEALLNVKPRWLTPPMGHYDEQVLAVSHALHMITALWTFDGGALSQETPSSITRQVSEKVEAGSIIRLTPSQSEVEALPTIIETIKNKGYQLGTLSALTDEGRVHE